MGKPRLTPISFVKTTESYEVSLVTINRQISYDSGILRQDYGIIQGLPMNNMRFADCGTIYRNGPKRVGLFTAWTKLRGPCIHVAAIACISEYRD